MAGKDTAEKPAGGPKRPKAPRRKFQQPPGNPVLIWMDRNLLLMCSGIALTIWLTADATGLILSEGTKVALASFVGYAIFISRRDDRWRRLEAAKSQLQELQASVEELDKTYPGSREAVEARKDLVRLALELRQAETEDEK